LPTWVVLLQRTSGLRAVAAQEPHLWRSRRRCRTARTAPSARVLGRVRRPSWRRTWTLTPASGAARSRSPSHVATTVVNKPESEPSAGRSPQGSVEDGDDGRARPGCVSPPVFSIARRYLRDCGCGTIPHHHAGKARRQQVCRVCRFAGRHRGKAYLTTGVVLWTKPSLPQSGACGLIVGALAN
jgi:hypothetical protein